MGSSQKIAKGFAWTTIVNIINGIYGFISVPILIAYFGKSDYGLIGLAMSINVYLRLMDMGLSSTNVRFFSNWIAKKEYEKTDKLFQTSLSFYGIVGLLNAIVLLVVSLFSQQIFNLNPEQDEIIKHLLYILALSAFISWLTSCLDQFIRANEYIGWTQRVGLLAKLAQIVILTLTVTLGFSIEAYYALTAFSMFIPIPFLIGKIKKIASYVHFKLHIDRPIFKEILPYTLNIFSFGLFQFSIINLRPVFLGMQGSIESVADYRILNGIISIVIMLGGAFLSIILPSASKAVATGNVNAQKQIAYQGTKYITIALCLFCFGVMSVSNELITLYVGPDYQYLTIWLDLWLLTTLATHNQAISSLILSGADIRAITYTTIASSIIGLAICWFTIPYFEIGGAIIGYGVYLIVQLVFYYTYYWPRKMNIDSTRVFFRSFLPATACGAVIAFGTKYLIAEVLPNFNTLVDFIIGGLIFSILYIAVVWFIILNKNDKTFFLYLVKKVKK